MNANISFPKWLKKDHLRKLKMPVLLMFGAHEFAFSVMKAKQRAKAVIEQLHIEIVCDASNLLPVSQPDYINSQIKTFYINKTE